MKMTNKEFHALPKGLNTSKLRAALETIQNAVEGSKSKSLFPDAPTRILLDVTSHKIPEGQNHFFNIVLPHSPLPPTSDILLVVPDDLKNAVDPEIVVNQMKEKLRLAGVKIREVMTLKQCKDEYSTFEAKRALAKRIDLVLADKSIFKCMSTILGREFYRKKKFALLIDLKEAEEQGFSQAIDYALTKTVFNISTKGPTSSIVVGHDNLSREELVENVCKISNWIMRTYPGGWDNVSKLALHGQGMSIPIIVYLSQGTRNDVTKAVTRGKALAAPEEDELSTIPGRRVRVHAGGDIEVINEEIDDSDEELIQELGVDKEISDEKFGKKAHSGGSVENVEEKYLDNVIKTQAFEQKSGKKRKNNREPEDADETQISKKKGKKDKGEVQQNTSKKQNFIPPSNKSGKKRKDLGKKGAGPAKKIKKGKSNFA